MIGFARSVRNEAFISTGGLLSSSEEVPEKTYAQIHNEYLDEKAVKKERMELDKLPLQEQKTVIQERLLANNGPNEAKLNKYKQGFQDGFAGIVIGFGVITVAMFASGGHNTLHTATMLSGFVAAAVGGIAATYNNFMYQEKLHRRDFLDGRLEAVESKIKSEGSQLESANFTSVTSATPTPKAEVTTEIESPQMTQSTDSVKDKILKMRDTAFGKTNDNSTTLKM